MHSSRVFRFATLMAALGALTACGEGATGTEPSTPALVGTVPQSVTFHSLGATQQLRVVVQDQHGQAMQGVTVTFGTTDAAVATVSSDGIVTAVANGSAQITLVADTAHGQTPVTVAQLPNALAHVSGDNQSGVAGDALAQPIVVQANDALGHPVANVAVTFATTDGGVMTPTPATTGANGQTQAVWTLGGATGVHTASATFNGMPGLVFTATAAVNPNAPMIASVSPDTLVEGQLMTITGAHFDPNPANDVIKIDSVVAAIVSASATSLTATVPSSACAPARLATLSIQAGGLTGLADTVPLNPARPFLTLSVGQEAIVQDPAAFCLQFRASATPEIYILGLSAPAEAPDSVLIFRTVNQQGRSATPTGPLASPRARDGAAVPTARPTTAQRTPLGASNVDLQRRLVRTRAQQLAELRLRAWEAPRLRSLAASSRRRSVASPPAGAPTALSPPALGDTLTLHVPGVGTAFPCEPSATIRAVVRVVGNSGIWVSDIANPTTDSLTQADIQSASTQFDASIYTTDTTYFGHPSDIDANGRVVIVLTWQVNKVPGLLGFVFAGDLFPGPSCPSSNGGEMYYGEVPDPANVSGTGARQRVDVMADMPTLIAHEFTHIIQFSQRLVLSNGVPLASWEAEGQATLAEELAGDAALGNTSYQNYGAAVAFGPAGINWYADEMLKWSEYYGDLGPYNVTDLAPEECTMYGNLGLATPCLPSAFYGASWIFQRYIGDQFGPGYSGGLAQLTRDWVAKNVTLAGSANMAALLGVDYDSLFARFATALAIDDRNNGTGNAWVPIQLSITSWDSDSIGTYLNHSGLGWFFFNHQVGLAQADEAREVRGGSTAYWTLSSSGAHPAVADRIVDWYYNQIRSGIRPTLWVVRMR